MAKMNKVADTLEYTFESRKNVQFLLRWDEKHSSSVTVEFQGNSSYCFLEDDERDPVITEIAKVLEKNGFHLVMDHTIKAPHKPVMYSLRFKKISETDVTMRDFLTAVSRLYTSS